jgi:hypothetical protein
MPIPTTTELTMDLNFDLYVLLFRFQRWLSGDLTGLCPTGRSTPVVGGNFPIFTLSNPSRVARLKKNIPLILFACKSRSQFIPSPDYRLGVGLLVGER